MQTILCAAMYYNDGKTHVHRPKNIGIGQVICGRRHHNCINIFALIMGFPYSDEATEILKTSIQGFLTSDNYFVTRREAFQIAKKAGQLIGPNKDDEENILASEDLY